MYCNCNCNCSCHCCFWRRGRDVWDELAKVSVPNAPGLESYQSVVMQSIVKSCNQARDNDDRRDIDQPFTMRRSSFDRLPQTLSTHSVFVVSIKSWNENGISPSFSPFSLHQRDTHAQPNTIRQSRSTNLRHSEMTVRQVPNHNRLAADGAALVVSTTCKRTNERTNERQEIEERPRRAKLLAHGRSDIITSFQQFRVFSFHFFFFFSY